MNEAGDLDGVGLSSLKLGDYISESNSSCMKTSSALEKKAPSSVAAELKPMTLFSM